MTDLFSRNISYMRVSVTSMCNMNCCYCGGSKKGEELTAVQIVNACSAAASLGIKKLRFTGGEPLLREELCDIINECSKIKGIEHIALTTNGVLLLNHLPKLIKSGLNSVNISLDTTDARLYKTITNGNNIHTVLEAAREVAHVLPVRLNCVPLESYCFQQVQELVEFAQSCGAVPRFIELMPMGNGSALKGVKNQQLITYLEKLYGAAKREDFYGTGPAVYYSFQRLKTDVGFISPMSACFCERCTRLRLSADGIIRPCLANESGIDIAAALKINDDVTPYFIKAIQQKPLRHKLENTSLSPLSRIGG